MPLILLAKSLSGVAERLARVAASDEIHDATPRSAVEGSQVAPDRSRSHGFLRHASRQYRGSKRFAFNVADDASRSACGKLNSEVEAAVAGADGQHVAGRCIHIQPFLVITNATTNINTVSTFTQSLSSGFIAL